MPRHYMIDIETWDTAPTAAIRAIAIVGFNPTRDPSDPFSFDGERSSLADCRQTMDEQVQEGRTVDPATVAWWSKQGRTMGNMILFSHEVVQADIFEPHYLTALVDHIQGELNDLKFDPDLCVWSRGHFDIAILEHLLRSHGQPIPWHYRQVRDVRTLDEITPPVTSKMPHHPLADCLAQIQQVCAALRLFSVGARAGTEAGGQ